MDLAEKLKTDYYRNAHNAAWRAFKGGEGVKGKGHGDRNTFQAESSAIDKGFRADLEAEYGITAALAAGTVTQAKADKLFDLAWSNGHASGHNEVDIHYDEMVVLVL